MRATREPGVAAELGSDHPLFQLPAGHSQGDLYQQRGLAEPFPAQDHRTPGDSPTKTGAKVDISRAAAGRGEVDDAHSPLARSAKSLHDPVAGTNAHLERVAS